jgi:hypothetical protein
MYVLVEHHIIRPSAFWPADIDRFLASVPAKLTLVHWFAELNGTHATCVWEADSVNSLKLFLEPVLGAASRNVYHQVVNREGIALPLTV